MDIHRKKCCSSRLARYSYFLRRACAHAYVGGGIATDPPKILARGPLARASRQRHHIRSYVLYFVDIYTSYEEDCAISPTHSYFEVDTALKLLY